MSSSGPLLFGSSTPEATNAFLPDAKLDATYQQVLKRPADDAGQQHYTRLMETGAITAKDIVRDLLHSEEWAARFIQGRSVSETVLALYDCALGRAPDVEGWAELTSWEPRNGWGAVIDRMLDCPEYDTRFGADGVPGWN